MINTRLVTRKGTVSWICPTTGRYHEVRGRVVHTSTEGAAEHMGRRNLRPARLGRRCLGRLG
ncbi:hypothetical protein [Micromonospora sp. 050-3]|uniref:hypothetical protein n=1 Tax=Micromonospora sp. 050-3 TaxID=2789265 RepID=UPI00397C47F9